MGYTHSWTQTKSFTTSEWAEVLHDLAAILAHVSGRPHSIKLGDGLGTRRSKPQFGADEIMFNGVGDDSYETFSISRAKGEWTSCKTARQPYDLAVTACLCYLSSITGKYVVTSDGHGADFLAGLEVAKQALPNLANQLDLPLGVMQSDRWVGPYVRGGYDTTEVRFCVNGKGYVIQSKSGACRTFPTHLDLARFLDQNKAASFRSGGSTGWGGYGREEPNIWEASGSFDKARHDRIAKAQAKVLKGLFPAPAGQDEPPPAFVRPGEYDRGAFTAYYLKDLLSPAADQGGRED